MTFEERHAQVDPDPLIELRRRLLPWASAPDSRGEALNACIVPRQTVEDAVKLLEQWYEMCRIMQAAKTKGNA
jgi:autonomous glycyl radical cofactor GrcA